MNWRKSLLEIPVVTHNSLCVNTFMILKLKPRKLEGVNYMGLTHVPVTVKNIVTRDSFTTTFLIDTGCTESIAPASELQKIGIEPVGQRTYELANGQLEEYQY